MSRVNLNDASNYHDGQLTAQALTNLAWERFADWAEQWREDHPDDDRDDYELAMEEYQ